MNYPVTITASNLLENTAEDMNKTAYSYIRFSSLDQKKGESARRQMDATKEWCQAHGYTLSDDRFLDEGKSAFKGKHLEGEGDLRRFLSLVEKGRIRPGAVLILESFDRFSRLKPVRSVKLFLDVVTSGIGMVFTMTHDRRLITEKVIDEEPYILYAIVGEAQRAHSESKHKSERVADACRKRKERAKNSGEKLLTWCPPWCEFDKEKGYVVDETRVKIVRRVYDEYLKGYGTYRIARMFNLENVPTMGHRGRTFYKNSTTEWYKKTVRDFLMDKRVYGYAQHIDTENYFPVIISKQKYNQVQNKLALRSNGSPTGGPVDGVRNLFTGICRCAHCGKIMAKTSTRKKYKNKVTLYEYLVCEGAKGGMGCNWKSVPYQFIEDTFFELLDHEAFYGAMTNTNNEAEARLESLKGEQVTIERQIEKLSKLVLNDDDPSVTLVQQLKQFEAKKVQNEKAIKLATAQVQVVTIPPEVMEMKNELSTKLKDKEFRLRVREYIRGTVKTMKLDTHSDFTNYQVELKNGHVVSVVLWKNGKEDSEGVSFQVLTGVKRVYDPDAVIYS